MDLIAAFRLFGRALPIHFALLGRKRKQIKSKATAKLIEKRTSIAAVPAKLGQIDTFLTPILSHCRLPLISSNKYRYHMENNYRISMNSQIPLQVPVVPGMAPTSTDVNMSSDFFRLFCSSLFSIWKRKEPSNHLISSHFQDKIIFFLQKSLG